MSKLDVKGFIFDLDGTLLNTLDDIALAMNTVLEEFSLPSIEVQAYRWIVGGGAEGIAKNVLPASMSSAEQVQGFIQRFRHHYRYNLHDKTYPYDGIMQMLEALRNRDYKLAVLSNKPQEFTEEIVDYYFNKSAPFFSPVFGQRNDIPIKPSPQSAIFISRDWDILPEDIAFVGDSEVDIRTAQNAGMISFGAVWGFRGEDELLAAESDYLLYQPLDLLEYI